MVFFAITLQGLDSYMQLQRFDHPLWLGGGVANESMLGQLRAQHVALSVFNDAIDPSDSDRIEGALDTIREHHPEHIVWVGC